MAAPAAGKQWARNLIFFLHGAPAWIGPFESEKVQMQAMSARIRAVEEKVGPRRH
jgi:hypothetical protein